MQIKKLGGAWVRTKPLELWIMEKSFEIVVLNKNRNYILCISSFYWIPNVLTKVLHSLEGKYRCMCVWLCVCVCVCVCVWMRGVIVNTVVNTHTFIYILQTALVWGFKIRLISVFVCLYVSLCVLVCVCVCVCVCECGLL